MRRSIVLAGSLAQRTGRGGHAWVFLQYLLGFRRLGWEVLFVDRLEPEMCHDDRGRPSTPRESENAAYLHRIMKTFGFEEDYGIVLSGGREVLNLSRDRLLERIRGSDLLLNVMGFLDDPELLAAAPLRVFLDIDPGFGQMWHELGLADVFQGHDRFVTIGENLGAPDCPIPTCGLEWHTTSQPVVLGSWAEEDALPTADDLAFTSVVSWRGPFGPIEYGGRTYGLRVHEFRRFIELPQRTGGRFEIALDIDPADHGDRTLLERRGWVLKDPTAVAADPWSYREFILDSAAEFMVAKNLYVDTRSGWISDRSLCYLAAGRPVLAQDTGFGRNYPAGTGLVAFSDLDEAQEGVCRIRQVYRRHSRAARALAAEHFDSDRVLSRLLAGLE
ncbi:MAG: glycosyltransferase [bacterium]